MIAIRSILTGLAGILLTLTLSGCISNSPYYFKPIEAEGQMPTFDLNAEDTYLRKGALNTGTRVLVAPMNHLDMDLDYLKPYYEQIAFSVKRYVGSQGGELVPTTVFLDVWQEVTAKNSQWYDAEGGEFNQDKYNEALVQTIEQVAKKAGVDVFLFPNVTETQVIVSRSKAAWGGVKRTVDIHHTHKDTRHLRMAHDQFVWTGEMVGLSLSIEAVNAKGVVLYQGVGGIGFRDEVLAKPKDDKHYSYERVAEISLKDNPVGDASQLSEGIGMALHPYLPVVNSAEETAAVELK